MRKNKVKVIKHFQLSVYSYAVISSEMKFIEVKDKEHLIESSDTVLMILD